MAPTSYPSWLRGRRSWARMCPQIAGCLSIQCVVSALQVLHVVKEVIFPCKKKVLWILFWSCVRTVVRLYYYKPKEGDISPIRFTEIHTRKSTHYHRASLGKIQDPLWTLNHIADYPSNVEAPFFYMRRWYTSKPTSSPCTTFCAWTTDDILPPGRVHHTPAPCYLRNSGDILHTAAVPLDLSYTTSRILMHSTCFINIFYCSATKKILRILSFII